MLATTGVRSSDTIGPGCAASPVGPDVEVQPSSNSRADAGRYRAAWRTPLLAAARPPIERNVKPSCGGDRQEWQLALLHREPSLGGQPNWQRRPFGAGLPYLAG